MRPHPLGWAAAILIGVAYTGEPASAVVAAMAIVAVWARLLARRRSQRARRKLLERRIRDQVVTHDPYERQPRRQR